MQECSFVCIHCTCPDLTMSLCPFRVVVVSNYTQTLDLLQDLCVHMGYTFCRLDGHTPTGQRQRLVDSFNSPYSQNFLFLLSSKAGGVGLNLIGASHLVLYDIDWNPANDIQVGYRIYIYTLTVMMPTKFKDCNTNFPLSVWLCF